MKGIKIFKISDFYDDSRIEAEVPVEGFSIVFLHKGNLYSIGGSIQSGREHTLKYKELFNAMIDSIKIRP